MPPPRLEPGPSASLRLTRVRPRAAAVFPRYSTIIREGALGRSFYILLRGAIHVVGGVGREREVNAVLHAGAHFGDGAFVSSVRRETSVYALEDCHMLQLRREDLDELPGFEPAAVKSHVLHRVAEVARPSAGAATAAPAPTALPSRRPGGRCPSLSGPPMQNRWCSSHAPLPRRW